MAANFYIRYHGSDEDSDSEIPLAELGESLKGFDDLLKEFARIVRINVEPQVRATGQREGSLVIDVLISWQDGFAALPFRSVDDFLSFLRLAKDPLLEEAERFFEYGLAARKTLNDWVAAHPVDSALVMYGFGKIVKRLMKFAPACKNVLTMDVAEIPRHVQLGLHQLIKKRGFKKPLSPISDDKVEVIEVSEEPAFADSAKVDQTNIGEFLTAEDQILPHLEDGETYELVGTVTSLKSTRGDRVTLQITHDGDDYNLDALPALGLTSKDYTRFYQEIVKVTAEVSRKSLYKKPRLRFIEIQTQQPMLALEFRDHPDDHSRGRG